VWHVEVELKNKEDEIIIIIKAVGGLSSL